MWTTASQTRVAQPRQGLASKISQNAQALLCHQNRPRPTGVCAFVPCASEQVGICLGYPAKLQDRAKVWTPADAKSGVVRTDRFARTLMPAERGKFSWELWMSLNDLNDAALEKFHHLTAVFCIIKPNHFLIEFEFFRRGYARDVETLL